MDINKGVAVAGIWLGVGLVGLHDGVAAMVVAICALFATIAVAGWR